MFEKAAWPTGRQSNITLALSLRITVVRNGKQVAEAGDSSETQKSECPLLKTVIK
jgi:hypothetical protein